VAESAVVNDRVLIVAFDPWARRVASLIGRAATLPGYAVIDGEAVATGELVDRAATAAVVGLLGGGGCERDELRVALQARRLTHLTVRRAESSLWVGPTVVAHRPGCDWCWQARQRQHAGALAARESGTGVEAGADVDRVRLGARAAVAVTRHVLGSPEAEAGVVRGFARDGSTAHIGRVIAVTGCTRCDAAIDRPAGWCLRSRRSPGAALPEIREEVKT